MRQDLRPTFIVNAAPAVIAGALLLEHSRYGDRAQRGPHLHQAIFQSMPVRVEGVSRILSRSPGLRSSGEAPRLARLS